MKIIRICTCLLAFALSSIQPMEARGATATDATPTNRNQLDYEVWKSALEFQIRSTGRLDRWMQIDLAARLTEMNPRASAKDLLNVLQPIEDNAASYLREHGGEENPFFEIQELKPLFDQTIALARKLPAQSGLAADVMDYARRWAEYQSSVYYNDLFVERSADLRGRREEKLAYDRFYSAIGASKVLDRLDATMSKNPALRQAIGLHLQPLMPGIGPGSTAEEILEALPDFATYTRVRDIHRFLSRDGLVTAKQMKDLMRDELQLISKEVECLGQTTSGLLPKNTTVASSEISRMRETLAEALKREKAAERERIEEKLRIEGIRSSAQLISRFFEWTGDPRTAKQVLAAAEAGLRISDSISQFNRTMQLNISSGARSLGAVAMTSNVLGALGLIAEAFSGGPVPEQMILDQLRAIHASLGQLHQSLEGYFASVNDRLNLVYVDMIRNLARIQADLRNVGTELNSIQLRLVDLERTLYGIEGRITESLGSLGQRALREKISVCIKDALFKDLPITASKTRPCLETFLTFASEHAFDAVSAGASASEEAESNSLSGQMTEAPYQLERQLNLFALFMQRTFSRPLVPWSLAREKDGRIPNPLMWAAAVEALAQYLEYVPESALALDPGHLRSIEMGGKVLEKLSESLTRVSASEDMMLLQVLADYRRRLENSKELAYVALQQWEIERNRGIPLRGRANATPELKLPPLPQTLGRCADFQFVGPEVGDPRVRAEYDRTPSILAAPIHLTDAFPLAARAAAALDLGALSACVRQLGWSDRRDCTTEGFRDRQCGRVVVTLSGAVGDKRVFDWILKSGEIEVWATIGLASRYTPVDRAIGQHWDGMRAHAASSGLQENQSALQDILRTVQPELETREHLFLLNLRAGDISTQLGAQWEKSATEAEGISALLRSAVFIGLGQSAHQSDLIHSMLFSREGKITGLREWLRSAPNGANTVRLSDMDRWFDQSMAKAELLEKHIGMLHSRGRLPETHPWYVSALSKLSSIESRVLARPEMPFNQAMELLLKRVEDLR